MKRVVRYGAVAVIVFAVYVTIIFFGIQAVARTRAFPLVPFLALAILGLIVVGVVWWYLWRRTPATAPQDEDIATLFVAANAYLASGAATKGQSLRNTAAVIVLGTPSSAKTTVVTRSPIEATLLSGQTRQEGTVAPPSTVVGNVWYTSRALIIEAGQSVVGNAQRWPIFVRQLLPSRGLSVLFKGRQASRVAVVCIGCGDLTKQGASESLANVSKSLNATLSDLAVALGVRLPVYVIFTQADLIPGFNQAAITLTRDETRQVVGATLPIIDNEAIGLYGEQQTARLTKPFTQLYHAFALDRHQTLSRGGDVEERASAYEFAREFRKIIPGAVQFLVDLCRPNPLRASPFLRGFYFVGVRPIVPERASEAALDSSPRLPVAASATVMLSGSAIAEARQQHQASSYSSSGRRPQWVFLDRLFPEVILADDGALGVTTQGKRVDATRRGTAIVGLAIAAMLILAFTLSFVRNSNLIARVGHAVQEASSATASGEATAVTLSKLDTLRQALVAIDKDQSGKADGQFAERFGLYQGDKLLPAVRERYFAAFNKLLMVPTRHATESRFRALDGVEGQPTAFDSVFDALKAYLITTDYPDSAAVWPLGPKLTSLWAPRAPNRDVLALAESQFGFYAANLPRNAENKRLGTAKSDSQALAIARGFLRQYQGADRVYKLMVDDAALHAKDFAFNDSFPETRSLVAARAVVRGPFTKEGWQVMEQEKKRLSRYVSGERWVTGDAGQSPTELSELSKTVEQKYRAEYIAQWRAYLTNARIPDLGSGWKEVGGKISRLGPPLLRFLAFAARNTNVDPAVKSEFPAVHFLQPKPDADAVLNPTNQAYADAVMKLGQATDAAGGATQSADPRIAEVSTAAGQVASAVAQLADGFSRDPAAPAISALLRRPADEAQSLVSSSGKSAEGAESFCAEFTKLASKYPFDSTAGEDDFVTVRDFSAMFAPGGSLSRLVKSLGLQLRGTKLVRGEAGAVSESLLGFINRATAITATLFPGGAREPQFTFVVRPDMTARGALETDEGTFEFRPNDQTPQTIRWHASSAKHASLQLRYGEANLVQTSPRDLSSDNPWALFKIFQGATHSGRGAAETYSWQVAAPYRAVVRVDQGQEVLSRRIFSLPECKP